MMGLEFGEGFLWERKPVGGALGKLSRQWEDGIYLGIRATIGEVIIGTERRMENKDGAEEDNRGKVEQRQLRQRWWCAVENA